MSAASSIGPTNQGPNISPNNTNSSVASKFGHKFSNLTDTVKSLNFKEIGKTVGKGAKSVGLGLVNILATHQTQPGKFPRWVGNAINKKWNQLSPAEQRCILVAAVCFLLALAILIGFSIALGPAAIVPILFLAAPLLIGGTFLSARAHRHRKARLAAEAPKPPIKEPKTDTEKLQKEKWDTWQKRKSEMEQRASEVESEKGRIRDAKELASRRNQTINEDGKRLSVLEAKAAQATLDLNIAKQEYDALKA